MVTNTVASQVGKEIIELGKVVLPKAIRSFRIKRSEITLFFMLSTDFYEEPCYDESNSALNQVLRPFISKGNKFTYDNYNFLFDINWDMVEGCIPPTGSWLDDVIEEERVSVEETLAATCVSGFRLTLFPISQNIALRQIVTTAYIILDKIANSLRLIRSLRVHTTTIFAIILTEPKMARRIDSKMDKKMKEKRLPGELQLRTVRDGKMLITVPLKDRLTVEVLVDSLCSWRPF